MNLLEGALKSQLGFPPINDEVIMRLRTIGLIGILVLGLLARPLPTEAQQAGKVSRIGTLMNGSPALPLGEPFFVSCHLPQEENAS